MANWGGLPSIVSALPNDVRNFLQRVKETLDGAMSGSNRFVTVSDLVNGDVAAIDRYGNMVSANAVMLDFTPPPVPTGLTASGALTTIMLQWNDPLYANLAHAEVWRASVDNQGLAVLIGTSSGVLYADAVDAGSTYYYWVRFVSKANVFGAFNAINGTLGQTSQDPTEMLAILTNQITTSQLVTALNTRINLIDGADTVSGSVNARVKTETDARTSADSANASSISTLSSQVNHTTTGLPAAFTAVSNEASTRATQTGELYAQWTVKTDVNGYVSGFGLASTLKDATPYSEFAVVADKFSIAPVATNHAASDGSPFFHLTTSTVINGVTVPAGTYMKSVYIHDASITNAKIANLAVDNAKIANVSVNKLTAGAVAVGEYIQSTGYVSGSAGWRIHGDGSAEFANIYARGNIRATSFSAITLQVGEHIKQGSTAYTTGNGFFLGDNGAGTPVFSLKSATNGLTWDGTSLSINGSGTFSGALSAATGTFSGALSAATGSFSGSLSGADISGATGTFSGSLSAGTVDITKLIGTTTNYAAPGTYTLTVPADKTSMRVTLVGGGGGGGGGGSRGNGGGGGGAGQTTVATFSNLTPGATYSLVVGSGGVGGAGVDYPYVNGTQATAGTATSVTGLTSASGGARGENPFGGGAGGSIGGTNAVGDKGGNGGSTIYGSGGIGVLDSSGATGTGFGSGGAGGSYVWYSGSYGGNGAPGKAIIEFFNPNGVVIRNEWNTLLSALTAQGIATS